MRRECRECFPRYRLQRKQLVSDPDMHHGTCVTHVPWCMSETLTRGGGETVPVIPGACATCNFTYLVRGPWRFHFKEVQQCAFMKICWLLWFDSHILLNAWHLKWPSYSIRFWCREISVDRLDITHRLNYNIHIYPHEEELGGNNTCLNDII